MKKIVKRTLKTHNTQALIKYQLKALSRKLVPLRVLQEVINVKEIQVTLHQKLKKKTTLNTFEFLYLKLYYTLKNKHLLFHKYNIDR